MKNKGLAGAGNQTGQASSVTAAKEKLAPALQRLWDLVRYQRGALFEAGLISPEEYAGLVQDHASVGRLETYDGLRVKLVDGAKTIAQLEAACEQLRQERDDATRVALAALSGDLKAKRDAHAMRERTTPDPSEER